jgi:hypothetical protein
MPGLVAYYPFDGDTKDASGNGHDITASNVTAAPGKLGGAYAFNGTSSRMSIGGASTPLSARSLCAWIQPHAASGLGEPIFVGGAAGAADFYSLLTSSAAGGCGTVPNHFALDHWGTACGVTRYLTAPTDGWTHACWTFDPTGGGTTVYANGVAQSLGIQAFSYDLTTITIGANVVGGSTTQASFLGNIDDVSIWNRALTPAEVVRLYAGGNGCRVR